MAPQGISSRTLVHAVPYVAISVSDRIPSVPGGPVLPIAAPGPCSAASAPTPPLLLRVAAENEEFNVPDIVTAVAAAAFVTLARARLSADREIPEER